jgi:hypothetical protein
VCENDQSAPIEAAAATFYKMLQGLLEEELEDGGHLLRRRPRERGSVVLAKRLAVRHGGRSDVS